MSQYVSLWGGTRFHRGYWWHDTSGVSGTVVGLVQSPVWGSLMNDSLLDIIVFFLWLSVLCCKWSMCLFQVWPPNTWTRYERGLVCSMMVPGIHICHQDRDYEPSLFVPQTVLYCESCWNFCCTCLKATFLLISGRERSNLVLTSLIRNIVYMEQC